MKKSFNSYLFYTKTPVFYAGLAFVISYYLFGKNSNVMIVACLLDLSAVFFTLIKMKKFDLWMMLIGSVNAFTIFNILRI